MQSSPWLPSLEDGSGRAGAVVRVCVNEDGFPYSFRDADGVLKGFSIDLSNAIARVMNLHFELIGGDATDVTNLFLKGQVDLIQIYSRSPERLALADFSVPYLKMVGAVIARREDKSIGGVADLKGRRVLIHPNSIGEAYLIRHGLGAEIVHVRSVPEALKGVNAGQGDATLATRLTAMSLAQYWKLDEIEARGESLEEFAADYCYAVRPGNKLLLAKINEGLAVLNRTGEYDQIYDKWFGRIERKGYTKTEIFGALSLGLSIALGVLLMATLRRRTLLQDVRRSEELYRGVFDSAHEALLVLTQPKKADQGLRVLQANKAALEVLGMGRQGSREGFLRNELPGNEALAERIGHAFAGDCARVFEHELVREGGNRFLMVSLTEVGSRLLVVITDLTDMKVAEAQLQRSEEQLRQTQKLEAIGTLASGVAHDFNNILTGIMGNAELAKMDQEEGINPIPSIEQIMQSAERAKQLVRQILTFSRKTEAKREQVQLGSLVAEALRFVRAATPSSITINHARLLQLPKVEADATQIHQVIMNLCTNAVHAMGGKVGALDVKEELVLMGADNTGMSVPLHEGEYVCISVKDTGCGMAPEVLARIFDPFYTTKAPGEGTGLGLSVVHGIVQKHGGEVTVYSHPGQGTVFKVYLPVAKTGGSAAQTRKEETPVLKGNGEHILVVDDESVIVRAASLMLERLGYRVSGFISPQDALDAYEVAPEKFDLIISDLTMPGMSGLALTETIRTSRPEMPVLLMSGFVGEKELANIGRIGFSGVLDKPLSLPLLSQKVREALEAVRPRGGS